MTDSEIVRSYREARYKNTQIKILSELTLKPKQEIRDILTAAGETLPEAGKKRPGRPRVADELKKGYKKTSKKETEAENPHNYSVLQVPDEMRDELLRVMQGLDRIMADVWEQKAAIIDYLLEVKK